MVWSGRLANLQSAALATRLPGTLTHHARCVPSRQLVWLPAGGPGQQQRPQRHTPAAFTLALRLFQAG